MTPAEENYYYCLPSPPMPKAKPPKPVWPPPPPPDTSEEARLARIAAEEEAKRVSDQIDRNLGAERERRKHEPQTKILLLGQAESGKSTVLKNFQLHFAPETFDSEAEVWRPIIHLNLVRSINFILNFLSRTSRNSSSHQPLYDSLSGDLRRMCIGLAPLREVEASLTRSLSDSTANLGPDSPTYNPEKASEVSLRSSSGWKSLLMGRRQAESKNIIRSSGNDADRRILTACAEDMAKLWNDPLVQKMLKDREIALQDQPGFFLDDIDRVTRSDYLPTPADILRARVTTLGPEEHRIKLESTASESGNEWIIYDVGGSRSQRAVWAQYFDDVNVIIFLAPLSGFNQVLTEDHNVNRLSDSMKLWQMICSNKILASVELILFLNKLDVLDAKLRSGVQFSKYVKKYAGRSNDTRSVAKYLLEVFLALHQQNTPKKRKIHPHLTCAIDTKATSSIIDRIHEIILVKFLSQSNIL